MCVCLYMTKLTFINWYCLTSSLGIRLTLFVSLSNRLSTHVRRPLSRSRPLPPTAENLHNPFPGSNVLTLTRQQLFTGSLMLLSSLRDPDGSSHPTCTANVVTQVCRGVPGPSQTSASRRPDVTEGVSFYLRRPITSLVFPNPGSLQTEFTHIGRVNLTKDLSLLSP